MIKVNSAPAQTWRRAAMIVVPIVLASCGSSPESSSGDPQRVASIGTDAPTGSATDDTTAASTPDSVDPADAMVEYSQCMRDEGIDMPDPQVFKSSDGSATGQVGQKIDVTGPENGDEPGGEVGPMIEFDSDEFQAADEKCNPILDDALGQIEIDPEVVAEQREEMLAFAKCMRENGVDFPDPEFGDNGSMSVHIGGPEDETGPAANPEVWDAANEACQEFMGGGFPVGAGPVSDGDGEG